MGTLQDTVALDNLMYLNNLVVNTTYKGAQRTDARRPSMSLPTPKSTALRESEGSCYESLCEKQPIGRKLFHQFLFDSNSLYAAAAKVLEELDHWQYIEDEGKEKAKLSVLSKICHPESRTFLLSLTGDGAEKYNSLSSNNFDEAVMDNMREATRNFLKGEPFSKYLKSPFFYRFLQWKEYEKQKITRKYFYEFRTLGKGGFGEVSTDVNYSILMNFCEILMVNEIVVFKVCPTVLFSN